MTMIPAPLRKDAYKVFHPFAYNPLTTHVHANFTNRFNKHSNIPNNAEVMWVGLQAYLVEALVGAWNEFFAQPKDKAVAEYSRVVNAMLGKKISVAHMEELHDLGFLPLEIKSLPEGSLVPYGVPCMTMSSTVSGFGWCSNMIETDISSELWGISTSATTAFAYRKAFEAVPQLAKEMIKFMGHDFSYRGMFGREAAARSGFGHLCSFVGSDTIPAALFAEQYYDARIDEELVFASVDATEHSVMCSYGTEGELDSLVHLIENVTPTGIISIVSDTWDFWKLVSEYLPEIKDKIMARDGTVVIRPDSGDPVEILCGRPAVCVEGKWYPTELVRQERHGITELKYGVTTAQAISEYEVKGLIECLWDTFGGTTDADGFRLLDYHIGAIYGDSITLERQEQIIARLLAKNFVPSVVLGIGSYTYQYVTRDTHGSAVKATDTQQGEGNHVPIFKEPKTDSSKKSAKGLLMVVEVDGRYELRDNVSPEEEASDANCLETVFKNGVITKRTSLAEIRERVDGYFA